MTAPTVETPELEQIIILPCADADPPCPMTGRDECPSDQKTIDRCTAC